jgi:hypothetical protein
LVDIQVSEEPEPEEDVSLTTKEIEPVKIQNLPTFDATWTPVYETEEEEEEIIEVEVELQGVNTNGIATVTFNQPLEIPEVVFSANSSRSLEEVDLDEFLSTVISVQIIQQEEVPLNYTIKFIEWTSSELKFQMDFDDPLLVSENV